MSGQNEAVPCEESARAGRRARAKWAIDRLTKGRPRQTQRALEKRLGLSTGYLCRLRSGAGTPSVSLVAVLVLLANEPGRLDELPR